MNNFVEYTYSMANRLHKITKFRKNKFEVLGDFDTFISRDKKEKNFQ